MFPNLFIIGAMKAGTSSLHEYLHQHPEIFMARMKEPQYFAPHSTRWGQKWGQGNPYPEPNIDWYLRLFDDAGDVKYAGESSVSYSARPWVSNCEKRIYQFNPKARIIYLLRDPIERAISHYWNFVADGREDRNMLTAMQRKEEYIARSNYALQLRPYLETFGEDQVMVLTMEELNANPTSTFQRLFLWLEVAHDVNVDISHQYNVGKKEFRQTRRGLVFLDTMSKHWRWKQVEALFPKVFPAALQRVAYRSVKRAEADNEPVIRFLQPILRRKTVELQKMLGRDFPEWLTLYPESSEELASALSTPAPQS